MVWDILEDLLFNCSEITILKRYADVLNLIKHEMRLEKLISFLNNYFILGDN